MVPGRTSADNRKNGRPTSARRRIDERTSGLVTRFLKVAAAFDTQIRVYDAGEQTRQAAIPLRNQLLISSQTY